MWNIFELNREKEIKCQRILDNEHLHGLHALPNIIREINSRRIILVLQVAKTGTLEMHILFWQNNLKERDHPQNPCVDGEKIFNSICENFKNFRIPSNKGNFLDNSGTGGFSKTLLYDMNHQPLFQKVNKVFSE